MSWKSGTWADFQLGTWEGFRVQSHAGGWTRDLDTQQTEFCRSFVHICLRWRQTRQDCLIFPIFTVSLAGNRQQMYSTYEIQYCALNDEIVKRVHNLFDGGVVVPPVNVEDIDVRSS